MRPRSRGLPDLLTDPAPSLAPSPDVAYIPSPTVEEFILATAAPDPAMRMLILMSSRGEGKTTGGIYACLALAETIERLGRRHLLPLRVAVIRDTWANLARTTLVSFEQNKQRGLPIELSDGGRQADIQRLVHFDFFGLDRDDDADKLQGFECGVLWLEEVAPAAGLASGVPATSLGLGATSVRQMGVPKRILVTMNPPDEDHWILKVEEALTDLGLTDILVHRFEIPPGEKSRHFEAMAARARGAEREAWGEAAREFEAYRRTNTAFLESIGRPDLVARLAGGQIGGVALGEAVVPEFTRKFHVPTDEAGKPVPLPLYQHVPIIRGWDAGLTPTTVWLQPIPSGGVNILGCRMSLNKGMAQHILDEVLPWQRRYGVQPAATSPDAYTATRKRGSFPFRDIGDPACGKGSNQANSEETVAVIIERMLGTSFEPGPVEWSARREALHWAFIRKLTGDRMVVQIDGTDEGNRDYLIKALGGRFHYKTDPNTGRVDPSVEVAKRVSGIFSHPVDALAYPLAVLMPAEDLLRRHTQTLSPRTKGPASWVGA